MFSWLPQLNPQVRMLALGRFLSEIGTGFTLFYAPIFFVNQVGLSATELGLALGSASIPGIAGRILGGLFSDSPKWGRRPTLLLSSAISAVASLVLAITVNFSTLVLGNLLSGFGSGLYWPATEAVIADLTEGEQRREAYAVTRLADNLGLVIGVVLGGALIGSSGTYRLLFIIDAISFVAFFAVVYLAIQEPYRPSPCREETKGIQEETRGGGEAGTGGVFSMGMGTPPEKLTNQSEQTNAELDPSPALRLPFFASPRLLNSMQSWAAALRDRRLVVFFLVNVIFTTYVSQIQSTLPLYFSKFVSTTGFSTPIISALFSWQMIVAILGLIPASRALRRFSHPQALCVSALLWAMGFILIWVTGVAAKGHLAWAILGMGSFAVATVSYTPSASALVADIAPVDLRGVYLSINSLCWAAGYAIGPTLGGYAMDQNRSIVYGFWLFLALSVIVTIGILQYLDRILLNHN
ncbi:MFS transporter [Microseira wollei]|uniref:Major facilitator transporter n=1 Tax=Microseira wollei NIES-4236 TaxID=2530354 RepID=A0AAV3XDY3_9CYAN|nr:MFS transporter [Microseira wollei]GET38572.1 major facilitator transporter [Microseira wollei NIES-4236]